MSQTPVSASSHGRHSVTPHPIARKNSDGSGSGNTGPGNNKDIASSGRFARACTRCRQQKLACKPGKSGTYPCARCEDGGSECILVEKQRPVPIPTLSSKISRQEASLSDLAGQLHDIQSHLAHLADIPSRLASLESKYHALAGTSASYVAPSDLTLHHPPRSSAAVSFARAPSSATGNDLYTPSPVQTTGSNRPGGTPQDSRREEDIVHDFEAADLNSTRLLSDVRVYRRSDSARPGKRKRIEDERDSWRIAFAIFTVRCLPSINFFDPQEPEFNADTIREKSPLLFWAVVATGARETPELYDTFLSAQENTMELLRQTLGGPRANYWDLCGAMVWNKWLAPVRPIGHVVDMAYELDIHRAYDLLPDKANPSLDDVRRIRLWISIAIQDYYSSVATGRPPHYPHRSRVFESARWLVSLPKVVGNDYRLLATFEYEEIAHTIQDETSRTGILSDDWENQVNSRVAAIDDWFARWAPVATGKLEPDELNSMYKLLKINRHLAKMSVYSVVLRGIKTKEDLTPERMRYVGLSVAEARANCQLCFSEFQAPAIQYLGETLCYAFVSAAVFLLKVVWLLPNAYDALTLFSEVEAVIETFKAVSGQLYAHFLEQILKHVRAHYEEGIARSRVSSYPPANASTSAIRTKSESTTHGTGLTLRGELDGAQTYGDIGHVALSGGQAGGLFNPFETTLGMSGLAGLTFTTADGASGSSAAGSNTANAGAAGLDAALGDTGMLGPDGPGGPMMAGLEGLGEDPTFWSWLAGGENTGFSPLVSSLDTLDQSIAMGGI